MNDTISQSIKQRKKTSSLHAMHRTYYYEIRIIKEESVIRDMYANLTEMRFYCQSTKMNEWNGMEKNISYLLSTQGNKRKSPIYNDVKWSPLANNQSSNWEREKKIFKF